MRSIKAIAFVAITILTASVGQAGVFTIGGFTFDEADSARTAAIVGGPRNLKIENTRFGKYSDAYLKNASVRSNEFVNFDRGTSLGWLLQPARVPGSKANFHSKSVALLNGRDGHRSIVELAWGENGIRNAAGADFVIYESGHVEGFAVSVLKVGSTEFSKAKYQIANSFDSAHEANAFAFELRDFGVAEGEMISAIRIQNIFPESTAAGADKVDTVNGQGLLVVAGDKAYKQGFPLLKKTNETTMAKETGMAEIVYVAALQKVEPLEKNGKAVAPGLISICGFTFNQANSVKKAFIVEGPANLKIRTSALFAPRGNSRTTSILNKASDFTLFDRSKTVGQLLRSHSITARQNTIYSMHVMFPDVESSPPTPNVDRCAIELDWDGAGLRNAPGNDLVVFEVDHWEGFAISVLKSGSNQWTPYHYQFANGSDAANAVNGVAFDLSKFGLRENEIIKAVRIRNLFNSKASGGADKVDNVSGQGIVLTSKDANYKSGFPLLTKPGGKEFPEELLDSDIVYVVGLHDIESADTKMASRP